MHTEEFESGYNARERHAELNEAIARSLQCCVCGSNGSQRTVSPCANIDCHHNICAECQGPDTVAASLGTCDDPACAVTALRDLREMYTANLRRAEGRAA